MKEREKRRRFPLWGGILLAVLLLILAFCVAGVVFFNVQWEASRRLNVLPRMFGLQYCSVSSTELEPVYSAGTLLFIEEAGPYQPGEQVLIVNHEEAYPSQTLESRYLAVELSRARGEVFSGQTLASREQTDFFPEEIVGRIAAAYPVLGRLYQLSLGTQGILLFVAVPLLLLLMAMVLIGQWMRASQDSGASLEKSVSFEEADRLDLFAADASAPTGPVSAGGESQAGLGDTVEFDPIQIRTAPPAQNGEPAAGKAGLEEEAPLKQEHPELFRVEILLNEQPQETEQGEPSRTEDSAQPESGQMAAAEDFDPDRVIEEMRRQSARREEALRRGLSSGFAALLAEENAAASPSQLDPEEWRRRWRAHPAMHRWVGVYRPKGKRQCPGLSPDVVVQLHKKDYADRRFHPSFITVVEEESPYHNRNGGEEK